MAQQDQNSLFSALTIAALMGEFLELDDVVPLITCVKANAGHSSSPIRFACCEAISAISQHLKPDFQNLYLEDALNIFVPFFEDSCQEVVVHACLSLQNLLEPCTSPDKQIKPCFDVLLSVLMKLSLASQNSVV